MKHRKKTKKLKRTYEERKKLLRDLCSAIIKNRQIVTFTARGKWFKPEFERLITLVKRSENEVEAFRKVRPYLSEADAKSLVRDIAPNYTERNGGYLQIFSIKEPFSVHQKSLIKLVD